MLNLGVCHLDLSVGAVYHSPSLTLLLDGTSSLLLSILIKLDADDDALLYAKLLELVKKSVLSVSELLNVLLLPSELLLHQKQPVIGNDALVQVLNRHDEIISWDLKLHLSMYKVELDEAA